ncbi:MAG TPA: hypothetical protein PLI31_06450 [Methanoregulaceae archaeon]|nr:hypothetical protein [Methanoregulaceae archaeon]
MPSNSDDDIYRNIARLLEHLLRNLPQPEPGQVVGFTVMTGTGRTSTPRGDPFGQETGDDDGVIDYECVEGGEEVFVTARVPADLRTAPYVDITPRQIRIVMDDRVAEIDLPVPIDIRHSHYRIRHGVMDVSCRKR